MELHEFNERLLRSLNIIDETGEGHLSRKLGESYEPYTINGKRVILPTNSNLRNPEKNTIVFHPLSENITRSESDVLKSLRDSVMYELTMKSISLMLELARVAATPSEHKRLDPASSKYLKQLPDMDEKTYLFLKDKVLMRVGPEPENRLVSLTLRKGEKRDGVLRRVQFKFPVLDALMTDEPSLLGVKYPSQKIRNTLRVLFQLVLGDEETRAGFDYGSKNQIAPYFHALLVGFSNMAEHLNTVVLAHKKLLGKETAEDLTTDLSWFEGLEEMAEMRRVVPPQEGNQGAIIVAEPGETTKVAEKVATRLAPADRRRPVTETVKDEDDSPPWEESPRTDTRRQDRDTPPATTHRTGKTLDEFLNRGRHDRGRRDDGWGRGSRGRGDDWGRDGRDERRVDTRRSVDRFSSRDRGRDDRGFGQGQQVERSSRWDSRNDRDDRGFGAGHRNSPRW